MLRIRKRVLFLCLVSFFGCMVALTTTYRTSANSQNRPCLTACVRAGQACQARCSWWNIFCYDFCLQQQTRCENACFRGTQP